jgi:hypothetical protein
VNGIVDYITEKGVLRVRRHEEIKTQPLCRDVSSPDSTGCCT